MCGLILEAMKKVMTAYMSLCLSVIGLRHSNTPHSLTIKENRSGCRTVWLAGFFISSSVYVSFSCWDGG